AERLAAGIRGVRSVDNDISIVYPDDRPDSEISADVKSALRWDTLVDHGLINVNVENDIVELSGVVGSAAEKNRAIADAWVNGVETVNAADLTVKRWARDEDLKKKKYVNVPDSNIEEAIDNAIFYDPRVDAGDVTVSVDDGVATLRGTVEYLQSKQAAGRVARNIVGVTMVNNRLKVDPEQPVSDSRITAQPTRAKIPSRPQMAPAKPNQRIVTVTLPSDRPGQPAPRAPSLQVIV
ncbi:MAG: BON domain-containing protein, partial [Halothiobacillaceae bacterium]